jgi:hypothetical protein
MEPSISIYNAIIMSRVGSTMEKKIWMRRMIFIIRGSSSDNRNE